MVTFTSCSIQACISKAGGRAAVSTPVGSRQRLEGARRIAHERAQAAAAVLGHRARVAAAVPDARLRGDGR